MLTETHIYQLKRYCKGDITKIEGYDKAMADTSNTRYECHHKLEIDLHLGREELIDCGLYYSRQPVELIILTAAEHNQLHELAKGHKTYATREEYKEANREQRKQRYQANRAEELKQKKQYYEANKEYKKCQSKVSMWMRRHPGSTNIPETWNEEDIKYFNERRQKWLLKY